MIIPISRLHFAASCEYPVVKGAELFAIFQATYCIPASSLINALLRFNKIAPSGFLGPFLISFNAYLVDFQGLSRVVPSIGAIPSLPAGPT